MGYLIYRFFLFLGIAVLVYYLFLKRLGFFFFWWKLRFLLQNQFGMRYAIGVSLRQVSACRVTAKLAENADASFFGIELAGDFNIDHNLAIRWLKTPNPNGRPNADVVSGRYVTRPDKSLGWALDHRFWANFGRV